MPHVPNATHPSPRATTPPRKEGLTAIQINPIHPRPNQLRRIRQVDPLVRRELDHEAAPHPPRPVPRRGRDRVGAHLGRGVKLDGGGRGAALDEVESAAFGGVCGELGVTGDGGAGEFFGAVRGGGAGGVSGLGAERGGWWEG